MVDLLVHCEATRAVVALHGDVELAHWRESSDVHSSCIVMEARCLSFPVKKLLIRKSAILINHKSLRAFQRLESHLAGRWYANIMAREKRL
jgi:hypothetical protein